MDDEKSINKILFVLWAAAGTCIFISGHVSMLAYGLLLITHLMELGTRAFGAVR